MIGQGRALVLLDKTGSDIAPRPDDIWNLVNFLIRTRDRARTIEGKVYGNYAQLSGGQIA